MASITELVDAAREELAEAIHAAAQSGRARSLVGLFAHVLVQQVMQQLLTNPPTSPPAALSDALTAAAQATAETIEQGVTHG